MSDSTKFNTRAQQQYAYVNIRKSPTHHQLHVRQMLFSTIMPIIPLSSSQHPERNRKRLTVINVQRVYVLLTHATCDMAQRTRLPVMTANYVDAPITLVCAPLSAFWVCDHFSVSVLGTPCDIEYTQELIQTGPRSPQIRVGGRSLRCCVLVCASTRAHVDCVCVCCCVHAPTHTSTFHKFNLLRKHRHTKTNGALIDIGSPNSSQ